MDYSEEIDYNVNFSNYKRFILLNEFDDHIDELNINFIYPYDSQIINFEDVGTLLLIINDDEMLNIKFSYDSSEEIPLKVLKSSKFSNISGHNIIFDEIQTFIHDKKGKLFKFRSSQSLDEIKFKNVLYIKCFNWESSCFVMISLIDRKVVLQLFDKSFDKDNSVHQRSVDLILPEDSIQYLENEFTFEKINENITFSCEMLYNITENDLDVEFFNIFLSIDVKNENIKDILLVSMNDRLFYVKYYGIFSDIAEANESISIETVLISRGKIKAMKYLDSALIILDEFWILTIFYQCSLTNIIKRREIPLGSNIMCYRFTSDMLIYSNQYKIVFVKFKLAPADPDIVEADLRLISTFSVAQNGEFLLAIDRNKFFYYVPIQSFTKEKDKFEDNYENITNENLKKFPETLKYLQNIEKDFKELSETIQHEEDMLLLLTHLDNNKDVIAGHAKIKYLPFLTQSHDDDIICSPLNSLSGHAYIKVLIELERLFSQFKFTIAFYRHTKEKGVLLRHIECKPRNEKTNFAVYVPDEIYDDSHNELELFAHFYINTSDECHVLQFPIVIDAIKVSSGYQSHQNIEVEKCIQSIKMLLNDDK